MPAVEKPEKKGLRRHVVNPLYLTAYHGGAEGNRTPDLLNAIQALSQLSYSPTRVKKISNFPLHRQGVEFSRR